MSNSVHEARLNTEARATNVYRNQIFEQASYDAKFENCSFENCVIAGGTFEYCDFKGCIFWKAKYIHCTITNSLLCDLSFCVFKDCRLARVKACIKEDKATPASTPKCIGRFDIKDITNADWFWRIMKTEEVGIYEPDVAKAVRWATVSSLTTKEEVEMAKTEQYHSQGYITAFKGFQAPKIRPNETTEKDEELETRVRGLRRDIGRLQQINTLLTKLVQQMTGLDLERWDAKSPGGHQKMKRTLQAQLDKHVQAIENLEPLNEAAVPEILEQPDTIRVAHCKPYDGEDLWTCKPIDTGNIGRKQTPSNG